MLPAEVARETIRQLALRKLPPTPENYARLYDELSGAPQQAPPSWPELVREILREWERRQYGLTMARKREGLEHVLNAFGADPDKLHGKLTGLVKSWKDKRDESVPTADLGWQPPQPVDAAAAESSAEIAAGLLSLLRMLVDNLAELAGDDR